MAGIDLQETLGRILPPDGGAMEAARRRWDALAKPLGGLGALEDAVVRFAGASWDVSARPDKRAVTVFCADNGVVAQGVTQTGSEVTAVVTENLTRGATSVCKMAKLARADVIPVDIGVARAVSGPGLRQCKVAWGTQDMTQGPAMTREQARAALEVGIALAFELKEAGYRLLATGEMGIGNTTTGSAVASVLLGRPPAEMTGRGAGLSSEGLARKVRAVETAIARNRPDPGDALDTLAKVGGLDIAGMAGVFLGGAAARLPVLVDGFISSVAALAAKRLCPAAAGYFLGSHVSKEPAARLVLEACGAGPLIAAGMHLGEGTGAVAAMPLLDMAFAVYDGMPTFAETQIEAYTPQA